MLVDVVPRRVFFATVMIGAALVTRDSSATPGKVVRVERRGTGSRKPTVCVLSAVDAGVCFDQPELGDRVEVIAGDRIVGEVVVTWTAPGDHCPAPWVFRAEILRGDHDEIAHGIGQLALIAVPLDPAVARVVEVNAGPHGGAGETVYKAIDRNGDGTPDFEVVVFTPCEGVAGPANGESACVDVLEDDGGGWKQKNHAELTICR